jgi:hypothetical protein
MMKRQLVGLAHCGRAMLITGLVCANMTVSAATPQVLLERSTVIGLENGFHGIRVPVIDGKGKVKYWDIDVQLTVDPDGTIGRRAQVTRKRSPRVASGALAPGSYASLDSKTTCTVTTAAVANGRTQTGFACGASHGTKEIAFANLRVMHGPVDKNHIYFAELQAAGIDTYPPRENFVWGLTTQTTTTSGGFEFDIDGCAFKLDDIVGAEQLGNAIVLSNYAKDTQVDCQGTLNRQTP